jgi:hypothetical protein
MPALRKALENPGFAGAGALAGGVALVEAGAADGVVAELGNVSVIWFPLKLREPFATRAKVSRST